MKSASNLIQERWPNAELFYAERDNRTLLLVPEIGHYSLKSVEIHVDPDAADDLSTQIIGLVAANLTARWARQVRLAFPDVRLARRLNGRGDRTLCARALRECGEADPFGRHDVGSPLNAQADSVRLFVGPWARSPKDLTDGDYLVDASAWSAIGRRGGAIGPRHRLPSTVAAAVLAGAIGAADVFKRAIGHPRDRWMKSFAWNTWSHEWASSDALLPNDPEPPVILDVGRLLLAGAGAIGSSLVYGLAMAAARGKVSVLDRDKVETSNLNRSLLFTASDAALDREKIGVAATALQGAGIEVDTIGGTWREHGSELAARPFDVWVSLTNEDGAWGEVPFQMPPVVVHGTTTSEWGVAIGRHIPRIEDCTLCRLPRPHAQFRGPCSEGEVVVVNTQPVRASLPFLSAAAAAGILGELTKLSVGGAPAQPNSCVGDFLFGLPTLIEEHRGPTAGCTGCAMSKLEIWNGRGGRSRFAALSL